MDNYKLQRQSDETKNTIDDLISEIESLEATNERLSSEVESLIEEIDDLKIVIEEYKSHNR